VGLDSAEAVRGEIVSADSVQVYRYMDIGAAKPTQEEQHIISHHMLDIRDPDEYFSAGDYVREAREALENILGRGFVPLVVGGTGLYIRLLLGGIIEDAPRDPQLREQFRAEEERFGSGTLFRRLQALDPEAARSIPQENLSRICRALEVFELTGRRLSELQTGHALQDRPYRCLFICLSPDRQELYARIDRRVDQMIEAGLMEEVNSLISMGYGLHLKPMQSIGYRHMGWVVAGRKDMTEAIEEMKQDTRRYAKRQMTWFRSEPEVVWCDPSDKSRIRCMIDDFLNAP
jgi:tRNA dimethylallyltransferase